MKPWFGEAKREFCGARQVFLNADGSFDSPTRRDVVPPCPRSPARDANAQQQATQQTAKMAKTATEAFRNAVNAMNTTGSALLKQIRAKAEITADPNVYVLAQIPAPATPEPKGAPGIAYEVRAELGGKGALTLKWKCDNPAGTTGTMYQVYRSVGGSTDFEYLGGSGKKQFDDATIPAGATQLTYQIQAVRSTAIGPWASFNVYFGTNAGGDKTASISDAGAAMKIAA